MPAQTANSGPDIAPLSPLELTGRASTHVVEAADLGCLLHPCTAEALRALRAAAAFDGIDLMPVSGFRDFSRQLAIWNGKFRGDRALLDSYGVALDVTQLSVWERVAAIMVWSALPGASRHHWGSDCDLIDTRALAAARARSPEVGVELVSENYASGGCYAKMSAWLDRHMHAYGFYRPYDEDRGGVRPEPWHVSFAPVAVPALSAMSAQLLADALSAVELAGGAVVATQLVPIFERFVVAVAPAPQAALAAAALKDEHFNPGARLA